MIDMEEMYTTNQIAAIVGIPTNRIRQWIFLKKIQPFLSVDGRMNFWKKTQVDEIRALMASLVKGRGRKSAKGA